MPSGIKYTKEELEEAVRASRCIADVIRHFGLRITGGSHSNFKRRIKEYDIDVTHFEWHGANQRTRSRPNKKSADEILVLGDPTDSPVASFRLRRALEEIGRPVVCDCGQGPEWAGKVLQLQVDHINGNRWDNTPSNVRFICPNCHTQTITFGSKNKALNCTE